MGTFIYFTEAQKHRANEVDLEEFLRCRGEKLIPSGRDKRLASDKSVTIRGLSGLTTPNARAAGPSTSCRNTTASPSRRR